MNETRAMPGAGGAGGGAPAGQLPDLNAGPYRFEVVQALVDRAAVFSFYSLPEGSAGPAGSSGRRAAQGSCTGFRVDESLHGFQIAVRCPASDRVRAANAAGPAVARFRSRWTFIPESHRALPGLPVPAIPFDPSRPQRFVMQEGELRFLDGGDGFRGFGTGGTFPPADGTGGVPVAAVGNLMEGWGRFAGLAATYTYCGTIDPERGFRGHLLLRAMDPRGRLTSGSAPVALSSPSDPEPRTTYLLVRGQKRGPDDPTEYDLTPDGGVRGFHLGQDLCSVELGIVNTSEAPTAALHVGGRLGTMTSRVRLNILDPGAPGTGRSPVPFGSRNVYRFVDGAGNELGSVTAEGGEGRSFNASLPDAPGQQALRFGAFQRLTEGTGCFRGMRGWLTDNSVVGVSPHVTSTLYVMRLDDPGRSLRSGGG